MECRVVPFVPVLLDSQGRPMGEGRGEGIHLSDVIRHMRVTMGELDVGATNAGTSGFIIGGWLFELWVGQALSVYLSYSDANLIAPGEMEVDGVLMTPDKLDVGDERVNETKATWKQVKKLVDLPTMTVNVAGLNEFFWHWLVQIMSYCRNLGTRKARLVVNFVNGDYSFKPPYGGPQFIAIDMEFSQDELETNWEMVVVNANDLRRVIANAAKA